MEIDPQVHLCGSRKERRRKLAEDIRATLILKSMLNGDHPMKLVDAVGKFASYDKASFLICCYSIPCLALILRKF